MKITEVLAPQQPAAADAPIFYSALNNAVQAIPQPRAAASQWLNMLRNLPSRGAAKQAEIEWSGILPWLQQQGNNPVTKEQLLQALQQNETKINTVMHGVERDHVRPDEQAGQEHGPAWEALVQQKQQHEQGRPPVYADPNYPEDYYQNWVQQSNAITDQMDQLHAKMVDDTMARNNFSGKRAKYAGYRLPGGQDYREMLLTTPPKPLAVEIGEGEPPGKDYGNTEFAANFGGRLVQGVTSYPFRAGNEEGNITYWPYTFDHRGQQEPPKFIVNSANMQNARFDSLEQAKAAIEQSIEAGYIGKARKDVYRHNHWPGDRNIVAHTRFDTRQDAAGNNTLHVAEIQSDWHQEGRKKGYQGDPINLTWQPHVNQNGVPKPHLQLAFNGNKEVGAVEQMHQSGAWRGYDNDGSLGDFDSEEEAKAGVLKQVTDAHGVPNGPFKKEWPGLAVKRLIRHAIDNGIDRVTWDVGDTHAKRYALSNHIIDITLAGTGNNLMLSATGRNNRKVIDNKQVTPETLADHVGKEAADRLLAQPEPDPSNPYAVRGLYGEDLNIGGEGMRGFYDQMLPSMLNKWARKYGSQVTRTKVVASRSPDDDADLPIPGVADVPAKKPRRQLAPAWELVITPTMYQAIKQGQPLWESFEG